MVAVHLPARVPTLPFAVARQVPWAVAAAQVFARSSGNDRLGTIAAWPMTKISPLASGT
jgi:hypothetical protein